MKEKDILDLVMADENMMEVLHKAESLNLRDWMIGAGFIRNKVWNHLHGFTNKSIDTHDIDLIYFDPNGNDESMDDELSNRLQKETGINWEVVNESYAHQWKSLPPYISTEDAMSCWPEIATAVAVTITNGELKLVAPFGIEDLVGMIIRPNSRCPNCDEVVSERIKNKGWLEKWPKLKVVK